MGWFNKKEKVPEVPVSPSLPELPDFTRENALPETDITPLQSNIASPQSNILSPSQYDASTFNTQEPTAQFSFQETPLENNYGIRDLPELPAFPADSRSGNLDRGTFNVMDNNSSIFGEKEVEIEPFNEPITSGGEYTIPSRPSEWTIPEPPKSSRFTGVKAQQANFPIKTKPESRKEESIFVRVDKFQDAQKSLEDIKKKIEDMEAVLENVKEVRLKEEQELSKWAEETDKLKSKISGIDVNLFNQI